MPRPRRPELALALGNLGAPGGLTRSVVLSLGAGLSLLVAVALADASLVRELEEPAADQLARLLRARRAEGRLRRHGRADPQAGAGAPCSRTRRCCAGASYASTTCRSRTSRRRRKPSGCSTATAGCPIREDGAARLARHRRRVVAEGLRRRAARLVRGRPCQQAGPQDRRQGHRQRARPQRDGDDRQPARGEVGEPRHQLRHAVLAQHPGRRAAQPAGHHLAAGGHVAGHRRRGDPRARPAPIRRSPPFASRTCWRRSTPCSPR